jgi:hypothetical protein
MYISQVLQQLFFMFYSINRVGETGLFPVSTSHTIVRAVRHSEAQLAEAAISSPLPERQDK